MSSPVLDVLSNKHCAVCPLFKSGEHVNVRNQTLKINSKYFPKRAISLLLVAESPPMAFSEDGVSYFYAPGRMRRQGLAYHTMCALFGKEFTTKEQFLDEFAKDNYLLDMVKCPINRLEKNVKKDALASCVKYLNEELRVLDYRKAVFIGKYSFKTIKNQLVLRDSNPKIIPLPFHSQKNIEEFRSGLVQALNDIQI
jgi:hypothetical protein